MKNIPVNTLIRTIITFLTMINMILTMAGINPIPFAEEELYNTLSALAAGITTIWSWWKNNSITPEAMKADEYMEVLKNNKKE